MTAMTDQPLPRRAQRSFLTAAWLGWKIESNWTDPFLFIIYSIVKPLAGAAILVVMYGVVSNANFDSPVFAYIFIGNAFYQYVAAVVTGVSWAVIDDREHYKTLKYIYTAPVSVPYYLLGRGVARILTGSFSVVITLAVGILFLKVPFDFARADWLLFSAVLVLGIIMLAMIGLLLAGVTLLVAQHSYSIGDTVAGALFLFSGAIFPQELAGTGAPGAGGQRGASLPHLRQPEQRRPDVDPAGADRVFWRGEHPGFPLL